MTPTMDTTQDDDPAEPTDAEAETNEDDEDTAHLDDLSDGAGCAEVWEHLSESRGDE